ARSVAHSHGPRFPRDPVRIGRALFQQRPDRPGQFSPDPEEARHHSALRLDGSCRALAGRAWLTESLAAGRLAYEETITEGLAAAPESYIRMLAGKGSGKHLIHLP